MAGIVTIVTSILLGLLYLAVSLTRPFTFTSDPKGHEAHSALPTGVQVLFSLLAPLDFSLGLDKVNIVITDYILAKYDFIPFSEKVKYGVNDLLFLFILL